jgi:hemolysin activation/secretion protein
LALQALANHTLEIEGYFQGPLGTDSLPRQRWSMVGGSGTLYTFGVGQFFGDRVVYLENKYSIPFARRFRLPVLGQPKVQFLYQVGMAWTFEQERAFEQNVGLKIQFPLLYARVITNPADTHDTKVGIGVTFPRRAYPWERRSDEPDRIR